jgi:antitoxin ParD1/3/4
METLSVTLPEKMIDAINSRVESGAYASSSEVLKQAVQLWLRQEEEHEARMAAIKARVKASLDDPRPSLSSAEMRAELDSLFAKHR